MKRSIILFSFLSFAVFSFAQSTGNPIAEEVFRLAEEGYRNLDAAPLLEATSLLLKHPEIRSMSYKEAVHGQTPKEEVLERNYFNPRELLNYAKKYAPFDVKKLQRQIARLEKKLSEGYVPQGSEIIPNYQELPPDDSRIENGSYLVLANNSREITKSFEKEGMVYLTIQYGGELKLKVQESEDERLLGNEASNQVVKYLDFNVPTPGDYKIIIENKSEAEKTCYLRVEYN